MGGVAAARSHPLVLDAELGVPRRVADPPHDHGVPDGEAPGAGEPEAARADL
jgi:hypothetical protein